MIHLSAFAQKKAITEGQNLLWTRLHYTAQFGQNWSWVNEADKRVFVSNFKEAQFVYHTHVHRKFNEQVETALGFTFSSSKPTNPEAKIRLAVPELRPFQELYLKQKVNQWGLQHRFRTEQRFFRNNDGIVLTEGYNFNWRLRYQIALSRNLSKNLQLRLNDELFINAGKNILFNTFDTNRIYGALNAKVAKNLNVELGYLRSVQQLRSGDTYLKRNNIDLRYSTKQRLNRNEHLTRALADHPIILWGCPSI